MQNLFVFMHILHYYDYMDFMAHYEQSPRHNSQGLHFHDYFEFYLHIQGGRLYCVDDTVFELKPNQLLVIPPLHMHGLVCDRDLVDYKRAWLYLTPETLNKCGFSKIDLNSAFEDASKNQHFVCNLCDEEAGIFTAFIKSLEEKGDKNEAQNLLDNYSKILKVLDIVQKNLFAASKNSKITNTKLNQTIMHRVLHYINEHYTENLSIKDLCSLFNMSESSLSHEFRNYSNKGVYEYILYKRIIKAKELLFTDMNLTQIALECGFNDYSNFLRAFKKLSGSSPKEYKNLHQSDIIKIQDS